MMKRYPVVSFFALAYIITWSFQIVSYLIALNAGVSLSNEDNFVHFSDLLTFRISGDRLVPFLIYSIGQFGPVLAAFIVTSAVYGRVGVRDLAGRILKWRVPSRWYLTVLLLPLFLAAVSLGAALVSGGFTLGPFSPVLSWLYFVPFLLFMLVFTGLAEEPGWRGFALPHLQAKYSAIRSTWIVGIFWGLWHLPFAVYYNREQPALLIPALFGLTLGIVGAAIVYSWVYNSTGSVFLLILLHGWENTVRSYLILSQPNALAIALYNLVPWAIAIYLAKRYGDENLGREPRPKWWPGKYNTQQRGEATEQSRAVEPTTAPPQAASAN
ncbi:MAG TPA: CPBP family intramembrane glutamic endopeptidase [Chloroflexia bacterium]|nr:CPBP family intramembrane glutamic endopeptidase [Chloroflexia bacterium]